MKNEKPMTLKDDGGGLSSIFELKNEAWKRIGVIKFSLSRSIKDKVIEIETDEQKIQRVKKHYEKYGYDSIKSYLQQYPAIGRLLEARKREIRNIEIIAWTRKKSCGMHQYEYEYFCEQQGNLCYLCSKIDKKNGLFADHDHKTKKPRKLLCYKCNFVLGFVKEDVLLLKRMIDYLEQSEKQDELEGLGQCMFDVNSKEWIIKYKKEVLSFNYERLIINQLGICYLCSQRNHGKGGEIVLSADHNHKTGKQRKLLCNRCNIAIGLVNEDTVLLKKMIAYLEEFK